MIPKNPWQSYRKVATQTASPTHLVLMMYEGILRFLERSLTGFDDELELHVRNQTISNNLLRAQAIIQELDIRLDMVQGGDAAMNFHQLYQYYNRRLMEANRTKSREPIEEVLRLIRVLHDSWAEMIRRGVDDPATLTEPTRPRALASAVTS